MKKNQDLSQLATLPSRFLRIFLVLYNIHPVFFFVMIGFSLGLAKLGSIIFVLLALAPPIIISFSIAFFMLNRRLSSRLTLFTKNPEHAPEDS